jgi:hypothetical protein
VTTQEASKGCWNILLLIEVERAKSDQES